jgi:hypothetical protein
MCEQLLQPFHTMPVQRGDRVEVLLQQGRSPDRDEHTRTELVLHDHLGQHGEPSAVACHEAQHRHVVYLGPQPRRDPGRHAQGIELPTQCVAGAGECEFQPAQVLRYPQRAPLP